MRAQRCLPSGLTPSPLRTGSYAAKEHAAGALANLANGHTNHQSAIGAAGALKPLLDLLEEAPPTQLPEGSQTQYGDGTYYAGSAVPSTANRAASALLLLCLFPPNAEVVRSAGGVAKLCAALKRGVGEAAGALMNVAVHGDEARKAVLDAGAIPPIVEMLGASSPQAQASPSRSADEGATSKLDVFWRRMGQPHAEPRSHARDGAS